MGASVQTYALLRPRPAEPGWLAHLCGLSGLLRHGGLAHVPGKRATALVHTGLPRDFQEAFHLGLCFLSFCHNWRS